MQVEYTYISSAQNSEIIAGEGVDKSERSRVCI